MSKNKNTDWFFKGEPFQSDWALLLNKKQEYSPPLFLDDMSPCEMELIEQAKKLNERIIASKNDRPNENAI